MVTRARWVTVLLVCCLLLYPLSLVLRQVEHSDTLAEISLAEEEEDPFSVLPITADPLVVFSYFDINVLRLKCTIP